MALLCITVSGLSLSWHAQEEIKHFKINLSSYGYLALSPSLYKFWPVNSWVCQNGLTCIKRSVDHSLTMTAQFRFDGRNNHFYSFIRWPVSFGLRCLYLFLILNCQFFGRTENGKLQILETIAQNGKRNRQSPFFKNRTKYNTISMPRGPQNRLSFTATRAVTA